MNLGERISVDPNVCHGKPCIRGTRIMVANILGQLEGGESWKSIKAGYPELTEDDIRAAIAYAAAVVQDEEVILFDQVR
jgi:uncharacterized protein (DUF433 family)